MVECEYKGEKITFDENTRRFRWGRNTAASVERLENMIDKERAAMPLSLPVYIMYDSTVREGTVVGIVDMGTTSRGRRRGPLRARVQIKIGGGTDTIACYWSELFAMTPENLRILKRTIQIDDEIARLEAEKEQIFETVNYVDQP